LNLQSIQLQYLLATVKGDVHDIGKNLVEIILSNNGFSVVNMGIKVPPAQLIAGIKEHKPDIVGLSGLLVKSAQQMVITAEDFSKAGVDTPILVGGAALSSKFVDRHISKAYNGTVAYAADAMKGLDLAKTFVDKEAFEKFCVELEQRRKESSQLLPKKTAPLQTVISDKRSSKVKLLSQVPKAPDYSRHVIKNTPIEHIWKFINPLMLFGRHLGVRGGIAKRLEASLTDIKIRKEIEKADPKALEILAKVMEVKNEYGHSDTLKPRSVYQFFNAHSKGNQIIINCSNGISQDPVILDFKRQSKPDGLCLSDLIHPEPDLKDNLAFFVTTCGIGLREVAEKLKNDGEYLKSHIIQALALETAEGYSELIHSQLRKAWGFADPPEMTMMQRFQTKYQGKRYSFGYPACPRLDDQEILFKLLKPADIEVELTEGSMMDPEASVSALVFHHPDAVYFSVGSTGELEDVNRS